jgi:hypothetical protein
MDKPALPSIQSRAQKLLPAPPVAKRSHLSTLPVGSCGIPVGILLDEEVAIELTQGVVIAAADRFVVLSHDPLKEQEIHSASSYRNLFPIWMSGSATMKTTVLELGL